MPTVINGLPAHVLLIHVVIVLIPLGALFTVLSAVWPTARRKLGFISPLTCLIALLFVPITTHAGLFLKSHLTVGPDIQKLINKHQQLANWILPFSALLFLVSAGVWWLGRKTDESAASSATSAGSGSTPNRTGGSTGVATRTQTVVPTWVTITVAVVAIVVSGINVIQLARVGDAGAKAAWSGISLK